MKEGVERNVMTSRECRIPATAMTRRGGEEKDRSIYTVDTTHYNDDGDCVPEGIILNRIKVCKKSLLLS